jgi:ribosomal protein S18 acetylase RimI-like enzyme
VTLHFRQYEPPDHDRVVELHRLGLQQTGADPGPGPWEDDLRSAETIRATYLDERGDFLVGALTTEIIVIGGLREHTARQAEIKRMRVHPSYQRRGFGRAMLERLEARSSELGYAGIYLDTTTLQISALALYRDAGYREVGRGTRGPFDIVMFEKDLGQRSEPISNST